VAQVPQKQINDL